MLHISMYINNANSTLAFMQVKRKSTSFYIPILRVSKTSASAKVTFDVFLIIILA